VRACFLSSRRRHTRCLSDWSSDVCSSDLLTGEAPFKAANATQSLAWVLHLEIPPLQETHPGIPAAVCELVDWLLRKDPLQRPRSDRKSTRLNSSHLGISYAVFCLKKKKIK